MTIILEVALGLTFVYLLFSLLVSAVNEAILGHLTRLRAHVLEESLRALLSDEQAKGWPVLRALKHWFIRIWNCVRKIKSKGAPTTKTPKNFAEELLQHALIKGLSTNRGCPNYIPANIFVDAVIGRLAGFSPKSPAAPAAQPAQPAQPAQAPGQNQNNSSDFSKISIQQLAGGVTALGDKHAKEVLNSVLTGAATVPEARQRLEAWFNDSMDRVTGLYKRYTQFWLYIWASIIVVFLNLDTLDLTRRLFADAEFRTNVSTAATAFVNRTNNVAMKDANGTITNVPPLTSAQIQAEIDKLKLPLGWGACPATFTSNKFVCWSYSNLLVHLPEDEKETGKFLVSGMLSSTATCPESGHEWMLKFFGLFITIAAVSQGAPFWFDLLNKLTNLRATGQPPEAKKSGTKTQTSN